jgi:hypothetical protein
LGELFKAAQHFERGAFVSLSDFVLQCDLLLLTSGRRDA